MEQVTLQADGISATIVGQGAELVSLRDADGTELLWQAGPAWRRHSPVLFPIVGRLKGDQLRHRGQTYPMTQHGFARDRHFAWAEQEPTSCTLVLTDDAETRSHYPFAFRLAIGYELTPRQLGVTFEIANTGDEPLPASIGAHPAFNWPLLPELPKEAYRLTFVDSEQAPVRRLKDGLLLPDPQPTPIEGKTLALSEKLFDDDAVILDRPASTSVRYAAARGPAIEMSWRGFNELGIWSKPGGAPFLCIEPWHGIASPVDFDGEFADKPGVMLIEPGSRRVLSYRIGLSREP
ncbi:aldose 1-epimerase family protein [Mesorhizobium sp. M2D.F.Ca.ET.185.01.1.1]|uniref:aldose 1-epimerase family protein n=1 Tax=unclassified Mesorhizobium TaxID=325217 RepID=UPI000FCC5401|nr:MULTISPECIES: aldose 1-epimerase family protein [unclassified Mesorhizobium]TGP81065.1 aldose 1-epimerase family protein [bacterium M00.F.Ca.ET.227.01.1.1]TGP90849.1 aldose 1-epimerase family protein [bacterium M00.F.Ca.ET.221.01.1.1]TGP97527.1 aldose 1-epimerase family protein [bacterium M00.F.Ca.ET.222.01.1.1]TGT73188.1 aldose 1-epimerase family protein [bacterium M00.F.Ca.ET.159.01.1.1]TGT84149.1 aldose 1-epimerase family protein [bacterium M00.F.Ca.ET.157.01.1.1]TGU08029.1 aldose 1-epi